MRKLSPPQIVVLSFLAAIIIGTFVLSLPIVTRDGTRLPLVDALFTATSATCVTGLVVRDTGNFFSPFGQMVILILFQAGGLGIMTLSTVFAVLLGKRLTIRDNVVIQGALDRGEVAKLTTLIKYIILITFTIELIGAGLLFLRWREPYQAVFHSISAFCNAGFSLFQGSFTRFRGDLYVNLVMTSLILIGGLGFVVLLDIPKLKLWRKDRKLIITRLGLQTKIVLSTTIVLILIGTMVFLALENNHTLAGLSVKDKLTGAYFQSITPRTAGFNTLPIGRLNAATLFFIILLMFIGASPGSTGGGIKTSTLCILLATLRAMLRNRNEVRMFQRTLPRIVVRRAILILMLGLSWIFLITLSLSVIEFGKLGEGNSFLRLLFEVTSAFGTVGLTTGITPTLSALGKVLISLTMLLGRIGPLTLALAIALRDERVSYKYPEEKVMVG